MTKMKKIKKIQKMIIVKAEKILNKGKVKEKIVIKIPYQMKKNIIRIILIKTIQTNIHQNIMMIKNKIINISMIEQKIISELMTNLDQFQDHKRDKKIKKETLEREATVTMKKKIMKMRNRKNIHKICQEIEAKAIIIIIMKMKDRENYQKIN